MSWQAKSVMEMLSFHCQNSTSAPFYSLSLHSLNLLTLLKLRSLWLSSNWLKNPNYPLLQMQYKQVFEFFNFYFRASLYNYIKGENVHESGKIHLLPHCIIANIWLLYYCFSFLCHIDMSPSEGTQVASNIPLC